LIKHLQVETTNICNAHCVFCPHDRFEKFGTMSDGLYEKIVRDASQYNLDSFTPMLTGEPFCDPQIIERIRLARELMPRTQIVLFTNGSRLARNDINALADAGNVKVFVSLNGASEETRHKLMGLDDWNEVKAKIDYMHEMGLHPITTMVWFPTLTLREISAFGELDTSLAIQFQSFAGEIYRYKRRSATSCNRVTKYMTVLWDGWVNLCCFDPFGKVIFGNLNRQTIEEVWNSPLHLGYLEAHSENRGQEMELCQSCTEGA